MGHLPPHLPLGEALGPSHRRRALSGQLRFQDV